MSFANSTCPQPTAVWFFALPCLPLLLVLLPAVSPEPASSPAPASVQVDDRTPFEDLFTHVRSIPIEGTEEHPVFDLRDIAVQGDTMFVLDQQGATLSAFRLDGTFLYQVGRPGRGPGEFTNPDRVEPLSDGQLAILESYPNNRIQTLSSRTGQPLDTITDRVNVHPDTPGAYVEIHDGAPHLISSTSVPCTEDGSEATRNENNQWNRLCVVQEHNLNSGTLVRRFATRKTVNPEFRRMSPYPMGRDQAGQTYVAHIVGSSVAVFERDGTFLRRFSLDSAPTFRVLEDPPPSSIMGQQLFEEMRNHEHSIVNHLSVVGQDVVLDHAYKTSEGINEFYFSIFGTDGGHKASTPVRAEHPNERVGLLRDVQGDRFYFQETDLDSELGSYVIHEYRYTGVPE